MLVQQTDIATSRPMQALQRTPTRSGRAEANAASVPVIVHHDITASLNDEIERTFTNGAAAMILLRDGVQPCDGSLDTLRRVGSAADHSVISGTVARATYPHWLVDQGHWWSNEDSCWHELRWIELLAVAPDPAALEQVDSLGIGALIVPASVWRRVGPFDLRFGKLLADLDWVLRARICGVALHRSPSARFLEQTPTAPQADRLERMRASLALAQKHSLPASPWRLALQRIALDAERECSLVQYQTDESRRAGAPKRTAWYLMNLASALRRERFRRGVAQTWQALVDARSMDRGTK